MPGNLEASELIYRTGLPPDDEAFMPAEGKTPLTAEQVEILRWWVGAGAPHDTTVGAIGAPGNIEPLLAAQLGLGGAAATAAAPAGSATADPQLVADLFAAGLLVRQVSQSDAHLVVSVNSPGTALSAAGARGVECGGRRDRRPESWRTRRSTTRDSPRSASSRP